MKIATVSVNGVNAVAEIHSKIPAGIVGATVELVFPDPYWAGLIINVQFAGAVNVPPIQDVGNTVTIPPSLVATPNELVQIGIIGVAKNGKNPITPTLWADLGVVRPSAGYLPKNEDSGEGGIPEDALETLKRLETDVDTLEQEVEDLKNTPSGGLTVTDDGEGNVTITGSGSTQITDDGNGNVVIS